MSNEKKQLTQLDKANEGHQTSPPADGERSYATQLLNVALVNDVTQRLHPPQFYSQIPPGRTTVPHGDATHRATRTKDDDPIDSGERITDGKGHELLDFYGLPRRDPGARRKAHRDLALWYEGLGKTTLADKQKQILFELVGRKDESLLYPKTVACGQLDWFPKPASDGKVVARFIGCGMG